MCVATAAGRARGVEPRGWHRRARGAEHVAAVGIGEAPLGLQGTLSLWDSAESLRAFAHRGAAHQEVIARTPREGWYAEELFARFAVVGSEGTLHGRDPLA